ncbi:alpha/beta hydrolase [Phenylobacterium sp.]|uniref:alpha/beta hydrolase n=1 Tax=Phenylobacterium sp. TaxID=1871053 RepID=UPI0025D2C24C|nr:alpha/beta hydrolase [Phenylobacterium sp.]
MTDLITFASEGTALRGRLYPAKGGGPRPVVVMAHGFSAVADQLERHARAFAEVGYNAFVYDHAGFGLSDGYPRQDVDPPRQLRGYRDAVSYVRTLPGVDPERIALWGSSFSGGHVLQAGALDPRVRCVVSQAPFISGSELLGLREDLAEFEAGLFAEREARSAGAPATMIPVTAPDDGLAALPGDDADVYFAGTNSPTWKNEVTFSSFEAVRAYEPAWWIDKLAPRALLMIVAEDDTVTPTAHAEAAFQRAGGPKKLVRVPGGHFDVYVAGFDQAVGEMIGWFKAHLG